MRSYFLSLLLISSIPAQAFTVQSFTTKDGQELYRVQMEDRFDIAEVKTQNFTLTIDNILDYRCPPTLTKCWDGGVTLEGKLNGSKYKLKLNEVFSKRNVSIRFDHMVGGYEEEPYVFDLELKQQW